MLINWAMDNRAEIAGVVGDQMKVIERAKKLAETFPLPSGGGFSILSAEDEEGMKAQAFEAYEKEMEAQGLLDDRPLLKRGFELIWPILLAELKRRMGL